MALRFDLSLQEKSPVQGKLSPPYLKFAKCVSLCCIKLPNSTVTGRHNCLGHIKMEYKRQTFTFTKDFYFKHMLFF